MTDFQGFSPAAQRFFRSPERHDNKPWFEANRAIYEPAVREPLRALVPLVRWINGSLGFKPATSRL